MSEPSVGPTRADAVVSKGVIAYVTVFLLVLVILAAMGELLRVAQGGWVSLSPAFVYQLMTAHGAGMVGVMGLGGVAIMWHFLRRHLPLSPAVLVANLVLFSIGAALLLGGVLAGGFAGGWTFLFPLPAHAGGQWGTGAAAAFLGGLLLMGAGFLVLFLDVARAVTARYGGLGRGLGWPALFGTAEPPPPAVVASTSVAIVNIIALATGATVLVLNLVNLVWPAFRVDALLAKNMTYFFGHVFINTTMYMSVIAVYEILSRYAGRPWKVGKPFLAAWTATTMMVLAVYPHHLFMDFVMPRWALVMGQVLSYASGIPVLAVTTIGTLALVHRSGLKWDLVAALLYLSVFGWVAGVIPAIVDATIVVNQVMHNTLWVPGHFHFYLILGVVGMNAAFALDLVRAPRGAASPATSAAASAADRATFWLFAIGGAGFATTFLVAGRYSVPRRYAEHLPEWIAYDRIGSLFGALVLTAMVAFLWRFLARVRSAATA